MCRCGEDLRTVECHSTSSMDHIVVVLSHHRHLRLLEPRRSMISTLQSILIQSQSQRHFFFFLLHLFLCIESSKKIYSIIKSSLTVHDPQSLTINRVKGLTLGHKKSKKDRDVHQSDEKRYEYKYIVVECNWVPLESVILPLSSNTSNFF